MRGGWWLRRAGVWSRFVPPCDIRSLQSPHQPVVSDFPNHHEVDVCERRDDRERDDEPEPLEERHDGRDEWAVEGEHPGREPVPEGADADDDDGEGEEGEEEVDDGPEDGGAAGAAMGGAVEGGPAGRGVVRAHHMTNMMRSGEI